MKKANLIVIAVMVCFAFIAVTFIPVSAEPPLGKKKPVHSINLPQTGSTYSERPGDDGDLRMGVEWPVPRFTDNNDGTVTDNLTKLVWPKNADCIANVTWYEALIYCNTLHTGLCDLDDNSVQGDWRLPNRNELLSLIDINYPSWGYYPLPEGHPFINVREDYYWTSSTSSYNFGAAAWYLHMGAGTMYPDSKNSWELYHVWPVRSAIP